MDKFIIVDSREKPKAITGILDYFERNGIGYEKRKIDHGDYMTIDDFEHWDDPQHRGITIDRKQTIKELAGNLTSDIKRFSEERDRAIDNGNRLVILVEQNRYKDRGEWVQVRQIVDLIRWSSPHTMVRGEKIYRVLASWTAKYPVEVRFCDKRSTGKNIVNILYGGK